MPPLGTRTNPSLIGMQFGHLEVLDVAERRKDGVLRYLCRCRCGKIVTRTCYKLRHKGDAQSCRACHVKPARMLPDDRKPIVEQHIKWAIDVAWRWKKLWKRFDHEIDSAVHEAVVTAARDFDATRCGGNFQPFCYRRMSTEVFRTVAKLKRHENFYGSLIQKLQNVDEHWCRQIQMRE